MYAALVMLRAIFLLLYFVEILYMYNIKELFFFILLVLIDPHI